MRYDKCEPDLHLDPFLSATGIKTQLCEVVRLVMSSLHQVFVLFSSEETSQSESGNHTCVVCRTQLGSSSKQGLVYEISQTNIRRPFSRVGSVFTVPWSLGSREVFYRLNRRSPQSQIYMSSHRCWSIKTKITKDKLRRSVKFLEDLWKYCVSNVSFNTNNTNRPLRIERGGRRNCYCITKTMCRK